MGVVTRVSEEEYLANPAYAKCEYVDGQAMDNRPGTWTHGRVQSSCATVLGDYRRQSLRTDAYIGLTCRLVVGGRTRYYLPDLCIVLNDDSADADFLIRAPDFVVEVVSQADRITALMQKMEHYFQNGTRLGWLVFPQERFVIAFAKDLPVRVAGPCETLDGCNVLPRLQIAVDDLFS